MAVQNLTTATHFEMLSFGPDTFEAVTLHAYTPKRRKEGKHIGVARVDPDSFGQRIQGSASFVRPMPAIGDTFTVCVGRSVLRLEVIEITSHVSRVSTLGHVGEIALAEKQGWVRFRAV